MSKEEFKLQCTNLKKSWDKLADNICVAHTSKMHLEEIIHKFQSILSQSSVIITDWDKKKELDLGNQGYLTMATNFPEISRNLFKISKLLKSFNASRQNLWKLRDAIKNFNLGKPNFVNIKDSSQLNC